MIRLKDNFKPGQALSAMQADQQNTIARWLNNFELTNGTVEHLPDKMRLTLFGVTGGGGGSTDFAWNVTGTGLELTVTSGEIELGPDTVIPWASIDADINGTPYTAPPSNTITLTTGDVLAWIWAEVDVENETAILYVASGDNTTAIDPLDSTEKKTILQKKIARIDLVDDVVTSIERYQCGNIFIPRL